jgi:chaperonin GroEL (HSP60 family)
MEREDILKELGIKEPGKEDMESILEHEDVDYLIGGKKVSKRTLTLSILAGTLIFVLLISTFYFLTYSPEKEYRQKVDLFKRMIQEKNAEGKDVSLVVELSRKAEIAYRNKEYNLALELIERAVEELRRL